jgi:Domain of unknown function (DUF932)
MKEGKTISSVLTQIKRDQHDKRDFITPTDKLFFEDSGNIRFAARNEWNEVTPTRHCLRQIAARSGIPALYADKMSGDNAPLLAQNVNWWWQHQPEKRMLRTLMNGHMTARAFLSDRYRPMENADLAAVVLPKLEQLKCKVLSCEITETRFYIQAATPKLEAKLVGDRVQAGAVISNSEVGQGALSIEPLLFYLRCLNGLVMPRVISRYHVGRQTDQMAELEQASEYYSDATREMDDRALWMKVNDVTDGLFDPARFQALVDKFEGAADQKLKGTDAIEEITERFKFNQTERDAVLNHFIEGGQANLFGLVNAVTRTATDVESYDRSVELQRIGGMILELPKSVWQASRN